MECATLSSGSGYSVQRSILRRDALWTTSRSSYAAERRPDRVFSTATEHDGHRGTRTMMSEAAFLIIVCLIIGVGMALFSVAAALAATLELGYFGIAVVLLVGYAVGLLQGIQERQALKSIRRDEAKAFTSMTAPLPLGAPTRAAPRSEVHTALGSENQAVKAFVEREMASTSKDEELRKAADLTARQLQQAIDIVEGKVGKERAESDGSLVGAVLEVLATNYRHATR